MSRGLFAPEPPPAPLAERLRPRTLDELVGHEAVVGPGTVLRSLVEQDRLPSLLLWGPPGSGKTSLARALAATTDAAFEPLSAVLSGVKDVREVIARASRRRDEGRRTLLFVDEIHRFNKAQQDAFLPHVEAGTVTLVGATTENPGFHVIAPLQSRCRILVLEPLSSEALRTIVDRALTDADRGLADRELTVDPEAVDALVAGASGDARAALGTLEVAAESVGRGGRLTAETVVEAWGARSLRHDRAGDSHYHLASALQKSIRSGDVQAGLYWCVRLLESGEDPLFVARRLVVIASEDVGLARPTVLPMVMAARDAVQFLGLPEGGMALLQAVAVLAASPKSNSLATAWKDLRAEVASSGPLPVPAHLRPASTRLAKELGHGSGYQYAHDRPDGLVDHDHLPDELAGREWFVPRNVGWEQEVVRHVDRLRAHRAAAGDEERA